MGLFDRKFLSNEKLKGFDHYKYSCIDNSPISVYISHPFWNWFVNLYPKWLAPNVLTLSGSVLLMSCYYFLSRLDYDLKANSSGNPSNKHIPEWVWLVCGFCTFAAHTLDGTDGKQARRIGASGPTGELFDHGLDSWSTVPFTVTIFSVFGQGEFSVPPIRFLCILISVQLVFIVTHWEKYNTGVLFLSWGYDASQYGLALFYFYTYAVGHQSYQFYVWEGMKFAQLFEYGFYICCVMSFVMSGYNLYYAYYVDRTGKQSSFYEAMVPMIAPTLLFSTSLVWAVYSPNHVMEKDPRAFMWAVGVVFSHTAVHLIIDQMSSTRASPVNKMLLLYILMAGLAIGGVFGREELMAMEVFSAIMTALHIYFGICIVRQLCQHFRIYAFCVSYLQKRKE